MKIIICEDNEQERNLLVKTLEELGHANVFPMDSAVNLPETFKEQQPDVLLLDIDMPEINGIEAAKAIRKLDDHCHIVYITGHPEYALQAFSLYSTDYMLKPVQPERLKKTLEYIQNRQNSKKYIILKYGFDFFKVDQDDIIFIEKQINKCIIHTAKNVYCQVLSIKEMYKLLDPKIFFVTHSAYIVNKDKIEKIEPTSALSYIIYFYDTNKTAILSRSQRHILKQLQ